MLLCCPLLSHKAAHSCPSGKSWEGVGVPLLTPCFYQLLRRRAAVGGRSERSCFASPGGSSLGQMFQQEAAPSFIWLCGKSLLDPAARPLPRARSGVTSLLLSL